MSFQLSYVPVAGENRVVESYPTQQQAIDRACALIRGNGHRQFEILDLERDHRIEEPLIRRHCLGGLDLIERA